MNDKLRCQLISLQEFYELSFSLAREIMATDFRPDIIVAIARGGFPPARLLCDFLGVKAMTSITIRHYEAAGTKTAEVEILYPLAAEISGKRVLIADDVNDSGETLAAAADYLNSFSPKEVKTAVLHEKLNSIFRVDFKAESVSDWHWIIYPWAVVEDVGGLILGEYSAVGDLTELRQRLLEDHGIEATEELLAKVKTMLSSSSATDENDAE